MTELLRLGVFGCGELGQKRIEIARRQAGVEVAAVGDPDLGAAERVAGGDFPAHETLAAMAAGSELDAVIVAVPPEAQAAATIEALVEHRLHVLCEAPFGCSEDEARKMQQAAWRAGRVLSTGYHYAVKASWSVKYIKGREIGIPRALEATWLCPGGDEGQLAHLLSIGLPMFARNPLAVRAWRTPGSDARAKGLSFPVEDGLRLELEWGDGARGIFTAGWGAEQPPWEIFAIYCDCSDGSLDAPLLTLDRPRLPIRARRPEVLPFDYPPFVIHADGTTAYGDRQIKVGEALLRQQNSWLFACGDEEGEVISPPADAIAVHRVLGAARRSLERDGERIEL